MSLNKVMLLGYLGKDAELKNISSESNVINFSLATSESYTNKNGEKIENTEWHNIVIWNKGRLAQYLKKGTQVFIEGKLKTRSWEDAGIKKFMTEVFVDSLQFVGKKDSTNQSQPQPQVQEASKIPGVEMVDSEDDLPF